MNYFIELLAEAEAEVEGGTELHDVQSSFIESVGYSSSRRVLYVEFLSGSIFMYSRVPQKVFDDLLASESQGKFFNKYIRGKFGDKRVAPGDRNFYKRKRKFV